LLLIVFALILYNTHRMKEQEQHRHQQIQRAMSYWLKRILSASFLTWRVKVEEFVSTKCLLKKCLGRLKHRTIYKYYTQWIQQIKFMQQLRKRVSS